MSDTADLFSLLGEPPAPSEAPDPPKNARKKSAASEASDTPPSVASESPLEETSSVPIELAFPPLDSLEAARARCVELLSAVNPPLTELIPPELPFPLEDDPFTKTAEEWEALWYAARESAHRVYLNARMEFRRQLSRASAGEPSDLKPWTYWVMNGSRPADGEPVHGLTDARRSELGWTYPGSPEDFRIYRERSSSEAV